MTSLPQLSGSVRVDGNVLRLDVNFRNLLTEPVYLMNLLFDWYGVLHDPALDLHANPGAPPTAKVAFVFWKSGDEVLVVSGHSAPPADGISPYAPRIPFGHGLKPGGSIANTLQFSLPLREWHAYDYPRTEDSVATTVRALRYRLDVIPSSQATYQTAHPSYPGAWKVGGRRTQEEIVLDLPAGVTLLKRVDKAFKRLR